MCVDANFCRFRWRRCD